MGFSCWQVASEESEHTPGFVTKKVKLYQVFIWKSAVESVSLRVPAAGPHHNPVPPNPMSDTVMSPAGGQVTPFANPENVS